MTRKPRGGARCRAHQARGIFFGLLGACIAAPPAAAADEAAPLSSTIETPATAADRPKRANFEHEKASREARHVADWVVHAGDNHAAENQAGEKRKLPFVIVDKRDAKLFVFEADGRLRGAGPALLGMGRGDTALPGIGDRSLSSIRPADRSTPAGRFVAVLGIDSHGEDVLWVDYNGGVAIHRIITTNPKERRLQRLATPTPVDNRISFGCINVAVKFYENVVRPAFTGTYGIVYVLPENKPAHKVFGSYDIEEHLRLPNASDAAKAQTGELSGSGMRR